MSEYVPYVGYLPDGGERTSITPSNPYHVQDHVALISALNVHEWRIVALEGAEGQSPGTYTVVNVLADLGLKHDGTQPAGDRSNAEILNDYIDALPNIWQEDGGTVLYFPAGLYIFTEGISVNFKHSVWFKGDGQGNYDRGANVNWSGSSLVLSVVDDGDMSTSGTLITFTGADLGDFTNRIHRGGCSDIGLYSNGMGNDTIGVSIVGGTHIDFINTHWDNFGRNAVNASMYADSVFINCEFDFCGSGGHNGVWPAADNAVIYFHSGENWAVDAIKFYGCRFENVGNRVVHFEGQPSPYFGVNKINFTDCKFEGHHVGGDASFYMRYGSFITFSNCNIVLHDLAPGATVIEDMFLFRDMTEINFTNVTIANSRGTKTHNKAFTMWGTTANAYQPWTHDSVYSFQNVVFNYYSGGLPTVLWNKGSDDDTTVVTLTRSGCHVLSQDAHNIANPVHPDAFYGYSIDAGGAFMPSNIPDVASGVMEITNAGGTVSVAVTNVTTGGSNRTINLPNPQKIMGKEFTIVKIDDAGGDVSVATGIGGVHIQPGDDASVTLSDQWDWVRVTSMGTYWMTTGSGGI